MQQLYTSRATSVRTIPRAFKLKLLDDNTTNLDIGGGRFDDASSYLAKFNISNLVYDPYNRSEEHNISVMRKIGQQLADSASILNVLNVIKEDCIKLAVLNLAAKSVKKNGKVLIQVWQGNLLLQARESSKGWQENKPLKEYMPLINQVWTNIEIKKDVAIAINN